MINIITKEFHVIGKCPEFGSHQPNFKIILVRGSHVQPIEQTKQAVNREEGRDDPKSFFNFARARISCL